MKFAFVDDVAGCKEGGSGFRLSAAQAPAFGRYAHVRRHSRYLLLTRARTYRRKRSSKLLRTCRHSPIEYRDYNRLIIEYFFFPIYRCGGRDLYSSTRISLRCRPTIAAGNETLGRSVAGTGVNQAEPTELWRLCHSSPGLCPSRTPRNPTGIIMKYLIFLCLSFSLVRDVYLERPTKRIRRLSYF